MRDGLDYNRAMGAVMEDTLFEVEPEAKDVATREPSITSNALIERALAHPDAAAMVTVIEKLIAMKNAEEDRAARLDFERQFSKLRQALPVIKKTKEVTTRSGRRMYEYAPLEEIQEACDKIIADHGFAYAWRTEPVEGAIRVWFDLFGYGHTRSNFNDIPTLKPITSREGEAVTNDAQATRGTIAYGKRGSMADGLGLRIEGEDTDGATLEIDDELKKTLAEIDTAANVDDLLAANKRAMGKYANNPNAITFILGTYAQARKRLTGGGQ